LVQLHLVDFPRLWQPSTHSLHVVVIPTDSSDTLELPPWSLAQDTASDMQFCIVLGLVRYWPMKSTLEPVAAHEADESLIAPELEW
jgi:hypothetical protein